MNFETLIFFRDNAQECLLGILWQKTVLYVTHQVEFLPAADIILVNYKKLSPKFFLHQSEKLLLLREGRNNKICSCII